MAKVFMQLENERKMSRRNGLLEVKGDLFEEEEIFFSLGEEGIFTENQIDKYIEFAKKTDKGKELLVKFIKWFEENKER